MSYPIFCSYFTDNYPYNIYIKELKKSLDKFNLKYEILKLSNQGDWVSNCAQKAESIQKIFYKYPHNPIFWLDADSELLKEPILLKNFDSDLAINLRDGWNVWSSQIGFGKSDIAEKILNRWVQYCKEFPNVWDQVSLGYAWADINSENNVNTLFLDDEIFIKKTKGKYLQFFNNLFNYKAIFFNKQASRIIDTKNQNQFTSNDVPLIWRTSVKQKKYYKIEISKESNLYLKKNVT
tara:strand:- start:388 stop:1095 length:708 start_codon:yes stop_codon:yes gene_type:complete